MTREKHYGIVLDNRDDRAEELNDGLMRGRLKLQVDTLMVANEEGGETEFTLWADPEFPATGGPEGSGGFWVPPVGARVEVEFDRTESGAVQDFVWICGLYTDETDIPSDFKTNYPNRRGWKTPGGFLLMFDDTGGEELFSLSSSATGQYLNFDAEGSIQLATDSGTTIIINEVDRQIILATADGNLIRINEDGVSVIDKNSNFITTARDKIQIVASKDIAISGGVVNIDGGTINLGDPNGIAFGAVLGELMAAIFDSHTHPTAAPGPPSPPVIPMASLKGTPADPIAQYVKLKVGLF